MIMKYVHIFSCTKMEMIAMSILKLIKYIIFQHGYQHKKICKFMKSSVRVFLTEQARGSAVRAQPVCKNVSRPCVMPNATGSSFVLPTSFYQYNRTSLAVKCPTKNEIIKIFIVLHKWRSLV